MIIEGRQHSSMRTLEAMCTLKMSNFPATDGKEQVQSKIEKILEGRKKIKFDQDVVKDVWDDWIVTFDTKEQTKTARKMVMKVLMKEQTKTARNDSQKMAMKEKSFCVIDTISAAQCIPGFRRSHLYGILAGLLPPPSLPLSFFPSLPPPPL
jgi:hypothetical protein